MFLFFGVVAVSGSYFVQIQDLPWEAFVLAVPVGLLAAAILVVNNVRDIETDRRAGKRTLAVRLGRARARSALRRRCWLAFLVAPIALVARLPRCRRGCCSCCWRCRSRRADRAHRPHAHRRAVAQRRAREAPGCSSSCSACCSRAGILLS